MKKIILSAVAIMALGTAAQAQDMSFGVKAGVNMASMGGDAENVESLTSFHVGAVAEFKLSETFSIQPELVYSMQGAKSAEAGMEDGIAYAAESTTRLSYLNIPIVAKYFVMEGLSLEFGPQIGLLLSAEEELEGTVSGFGMSESFSETTDVKDETNGLDFGVVAGAGYELPMGLFFQARYNVGLSNVYDGEGSDDYKLTNNVFSVSVGYKF